MKARINKLMPEISGAKRALIVSVIATVAVFVGLVIVIQPPDNSNSPGWLQDEPDSVSRLEAAVGMRDENSSNEIALINASIAANGGAPVTLAQLQ